MIAENFRERLRAEPFVPFIVHLADGRSFRVDHRELGWISPGGRTVVVSRPAGESYDILDTLLVTSIQVLAKEKGGRNGSSGSSRRK